MKLSYFLMSLINVLLLLSLVNSYRSKYRLRHRSRNHFWNHKQFNLYLSKSHSHVKTPPRPPTGIPRGVVQYTNEIHTLKNPFRIYRTKNEGNIYARVRFIHQNPKNAGKKGLNHLDYKFVQFDRDEIIIYNIDQTLKIFNENTINTSNYLITYKFQNIDLPCNNLFYICTLGELKREYQRKLKEVDFRTNRHVSQALMNKKADTHCIVLTIGYFKKLKDLPYLCFDDLEDTIFYSNLISERVMKNFNKDYQGALRLVDQVRYCYIVQISSLYCFII